MQSGEPLQDYLVRMLDRNGKTRFLEIGISVLRNAETVTGIMGSARDVTARVRAAEALKDSEARLRSLSKVTVEGICFHEKGRIIDVNESFVRLAGYDRASLIGTDAVDLLVTPEYRRQVREKIDQDTDRPYEIEIRTGDGTVVPVEILNWQASYKDRIVGTVSMRDITRRKENEKQLVQMQKMEALGTLAGGIAHDFNNLLSGILGNVNLLQIHAGEDPRLTKRLKSVENLLLTGANHAKQLLVFARGNKSDARATDLNQLVRNTAELFSRTRRQIVIEETFDPELWPVQADASQLEQVVLNLLLNAGDAMPDGGRLNLTTEKKVLDATEARSRKVAAGRYVRLCVADTGHGMDETTCGRIFEPFFTTKAEGKGTGLGLASAYGIVKNHGGFIDVNSLPGRGTVFEVVLPASEGKVAAESDRDEAILRGTETLLLVDDEPEIREVAREMLKCMGYSVRTASDGASAADIYRENRHRIDLVILDMVMPEMSGGKTFDALRRIDPSVRVLLASGYSHPGEAERILARGCCGFLQKPFRAVDFSRKVRAAIDADLRSSLPG